MIKLLVLKCVLLNYIYLYGVVDPLKYIVTVYIQILYFFIVVCIIGLVADCVTQIVHDPLKHEVDNQPLVALLYTGMDIY